MNSLSHTVKKIICKGVWTGIWHVQRRRWWVFHAMILFASACLMLKSSQLPKDQTTFLWFPVVFWQGVAASGFAAALVSMLQLLAITTDKAEDKYFKNESLKFKKVGLHDVFAERGTTIASEQYRSKIATARKRIWAFGMTNAKLIRDHGPAIIDAAANHKGIDVIVAFWHPQAKLTCGTMTCSLADIQSMIENDSTCSSNTPKQIEDRQDKFATAIKIAN